MFYVSPCTKGIFDKGRHLFFFVVVVVVVVFFFLKQNSKEQTLTTTGWIAAVSCASVFSKFILTNKATLLHNILVV